VSDEELIARLRSADLYNAQHYERDPLHKQAADRIEALEAKLAKVVAAAGKMLDAFCVHEDSHQSAAYESMCAALAETERESHD
jgi:hypothetical protein